MSRFRHRTGTTYPTGDLREELSTVVRESILSLFESLNIPASHAGDVDPRHAQWSDPMALIGFTSDQLMGTLILSGPWPMMAATNPVGERRPEALADWSRELSNMALGRIKLALIDRGVRVQIGLPTSVVSSDLRIVTSSPCPIGHRFALDGGALLVALDIAVSPSLELQPGPELLPAGKPVPACFF